LRKTGEHLKFFAAKNAGNKYENDSYPMVLIPERLRN